MLNRILPLLICAQLACLAQPTWEVGGAVGVSMYNGGSITMGSETATASVRTRYAVGFVIGEDRFEHLSGEVRFTYHDGDPWVRGRDVWLHVRGMSYTTTYEFLIHPRPRSSNLRPYIALGAGAKLYRTDWPAPEPQPFPDIAVMTMENNWRPAVSVGGGVKWRVHDRIILRFDFRDFITPFPRGLIRPAERAASRGIFHQITPMFGISYPF